MINLIREILNCVLIRNVFYHKSGSWIVSNVHWTYFKDITVVIFEFVRHNVLWTYQKRLSKYLRLATIHNLCLILSVRLWKVTGVPVNSTGMTDMTVFAIRWAGSLWKSVMQKLCLSPLLLFTVLGFCLLNLTPWTTKAFFLNLRNYQVWCLQWRVRW